MLYKEISKRFASLDTKRIPEDRKIILQQVIDYIQTKTKQNKKVQINFICTHNSRRSQFAQVLAQAMSYYFRCNNIHFYSGGTEVTALFPVVAETLFDFGFQVKKKGDKSNPLYKISYTDDAQAIDCFSKKIDHPENPKNEFIAIMTCSHADENCPFIPGAEIRIPLNYDDPKAFDGTDFQKEKYLETTIKIASEMKFIFEKT